MSLKTSTEAAHALSSTARTVNRWAKIQGIGTMYGVQRLFTDADIEQLRKFVKHRKGNPLMGKEQPESYRRKKMKK